MIKFVGFDSGKFRTEFVDNELISFISIPVSENH